MPVLCIETSIVNKIYSTAYNIACCECRSIGLASTRGTKGMAIITMVAI